MGWMVLVLLNGLVTIALPAFTTAREARLQKLLDTVPARAAMFRRRQRWPSSDSTACA